MDNTKLGDTEDRYGLCRESERDEVRQAAQHSRDYEKSKDKPVDILRSMTNKELDEKINQLFNTQTAICKLPSANMEKLGISYDRQTHW